MDKKVILITIFLLINMLFIVSSVPPFQTNTENGLLIRAPGIDFLKEGENNNFSIHVFNASNTAYITSNTDCFFHLYNSSSDHILTLKQNKTSYDFDYNFLVLGNNLTLGDYFVNYQCNSTNGLSGGARYDFVVNPLGREMGLNFLIVNIFFILCIIFLIFILNAIHKETDFDGLSSKILDNSKNMGTILVKGIVLSLFKNLFIWVYFLVWIIIIIFKGIIYPFTSLEIYSIFVLISNIYSLGLILVVVYMIGYTISYMRDMINILTENNWGLNSK